MLYRFKLLRFFSKLPKFGVFGVFLQSRLVFVVFWVCVSALAVDIYVEEKSISTKNSI
jgi:hypothetical protein